MIFIFSSVTFKLCLLLFSLTKISFEDFIKGDSFSSFALNSSYSSIFNVCNWLLPRSSSFCSSLSVEISGINNPLNELLFGSSVAGFSIELYNCTF